MYYTSLCQNKGSRQTASQTNRQIHTHARQLYHNPRCAHLPRVNDSCTLLTRQWYAKLDALDGLITMPWSILLTMLKPPRHLSPTTRNHFEVNRRHQEELPSKQVDSFLCHEYQQSLCSVSNWQTPALCLQEQVYVTWPNGILRRPIASAWTAWGQAMQVTPSLSCLPETTPHSPTCERQGKTSKLSSVWSQYQVHFQPHC